jgi:hypothetical protein
VWDTVGSQARKALDGDAATCARNQFLLLDRHGYLEENYWTFSYGPVHRADGAVKGVFVATTDTTPVVLGERRLRALRELGSVSSTDARSEADAFGSVIRGARPAHRRRAVRARLRVRRPRKAGRLLRRGARRSLRARRRGSDRAGRPWAGHRAARPLPGRVHRRDRRWRTTRCSRGVHRHRPRPHGTGRCDRARGEPVPGTSPSDDAPRRWPTSMRPRRGCSKTSATSSALPSRCCSDRSRRCSVLRKPHCPRRTGPHWKERIAPLLACNAWSTRSWTSPAPTGAA